MKRKRFLLLTSLAFILICAVIICIYSITRLSSEPFCKDCNIVLISLDTLNANHLPCYGYERNTAPNLCKFANENITFTNSFSNANYTLPSHVSIFTGLYPSLHKIDYSGNNYLPPSTPFLPEILKKNGYRTYFYMPTNMSHFPIDSVYYRGIDTITDSKHPEIDWNEGLNTLKSNNEKGQKTFLFFHTYWTHSLYTPEHIDQSLFVDSTIESGIPQSYEEMTRCDSGFLRYLTAALKNNLDDVYITNTSLFSVYESMYKRLSSLNNSASDKQFCEDYKDNKYLTVYYVQYRSSLVDITDSKTVTQLVDLYDSKIFEVDEYLQLIFSYISNSNLKNNTIIILTSDHGEEFMEHGEWTHGKNLYDTSLKIPLIMHIPGKKNIKKTNITQSVDIVPTILGLLGIHNSFSFSGKDLFSKNIFFEIPYTVAQRENGNGVIRDGQWKLFYQVKDAVPVGLQLFNYVKDPSEKNNIVLSNVDVVRRLIKNIPK